MLYNRTVDNLKREETKMRYLITQMKEYQGFTVEADTEEEAIQKAKEWTDIKVEEDKRQTL